MNYNSKNYKDIRFVTQEEINNMSHNEKFLSCKCGKKEEFRWKESDLSYHNGKGVFFSVKPFKGKNGEEVCHKCAMCARCGKEACNAYENGFYEHERTNDSPSGEWLLAYCSKECLERREKPSLPKEQEQPKKTITCLHCGKSKEVSGYNANAYTTEKVTCSDGCYEAFTGSKMIHDKVCCHICSKVFELKPLSKEEIDEGWCYGGGEFYCSKICFQKWRDRWTNTNYSPSSNPVTLTSPNSQPITNSNDKNNNSVGPVNVSPSNSEPKNSSEIRISLNQVGEPKNNPGVKPQNKDNNQMLVINLKDIKQISLVGDNLVIEFNQSEQAQTVVSEQVNSSQELSAVKNYLQTNHRSSANGQELANIISQKDKGADNSDSKSPNQLSKSLLLWIAGVGAIGVMTGLCCGLVIKAKKLRSKKK